MTVLLNSSAAYVSFQPQQSAFESAKKLVQDVPSLKYFRIGQKVVMSADASSYGLGAVLLQWEDEKMVHIALT